MLIGTITSESELRQSLKPFAPYSIVDRGFEYSNFGQVSDCERQDDVVTATVVVENDEFQPEIFLKKNEIQKAECSCLPAEDIAEQWCPHLIALAFKGLELNYFNPGAANNRPADDGDQSMSEIKINEMTSGQVAEHIRAANSLGFHDVKAEYFPNITMQVELSNTSLKLNLAFDDHVISGSQPEAGQKNSSRELDNVLVQTLFDEAEWNESENFWYIGSAGSIETVLGIIQEYEDVIYIPSGKKLKFSRNLIRSLVEIEWQDSAVELLQFWILPDGSRKYRESEIIGNQGTFTAEGKDNWTIVDNTVFKLEPAASKLSEIFPHSAALIFSWGQASSIMELLHQNLIPTELLSIKNPKKQPDAEIKQPKVRFIFEPDVSNVDLRNNTAATSGKPLEIEARLFFDYPQAPADKKLVYLADREYETECTDLLLSLGFASEEQEVWKIQGDDALDLISEEALPFKSEWEVENFADIRTAVKFSELSVKLNISDNDEDKSDLDWFKCSISLHQNNAKIPIGKIFQTKAGTYNRWMQLDNGSWAKIPGGGINKLKTTIGLVTNNYRHRNEIESKVSTAQAVALYQHANDDFKVTATEQIATVAEKLANFDEIKEIKPSAQFNGKLRKYQNEGLSWLNFLNEYNFGGILADEMGLGKTVQTLVMLQYLKNLKDKDKKLTKPALIVAPTSVTTNWLYETQKFTPDLKAMVLHGTNRKALFPEIEKHDVVITSYALLRIDRTQLEKKKFDYIVLDEAQNIKNPLTATAKAAKAIKAKHRLALTGTPTENRPLELWSIFDYLMPGYLGSLEFFRNQIEKPILESENSAETIKLLNNKTKPFILRRLKNDVEKELPPKVEQEMRVPMSESQAGLYAQILEEVRPKVMDAVDQRGVRGASISILAALLRLRQVCNHPNSIEGLKDLPDFTSGKFDLLKELVIESLANGRKILLFSQFREMLNIIRKWLNSDEIKHLYLDGSTKNRQDLVDTFNSDPSVKLFLISLKAGGTGLNLTGADTVIIYDPWWNPAVESQAVDRAHRIGQSKTVNVYRLVTEDSIEQKIMNLKTKKSNLIDALINDNGMSGLSLTKEELSSLFSPMKE